MIIPILLTLILPILGFKFHHNTIGNRKLHRHVTRLNTDMYDDDSYELLDLSKPISIPQALQQEYSIDDPTNGSIMPIKRNKQKFDLRQIDPEYQIDLEGNESWLVVVRDSIEQRLGRPIWTNKSAQQLQMEYRRSQFLKAMRLPDYVRQLIEVVYIERSMTMKEYNQQFKYEVKEFRKWMSEQKQRLGKGKAKKSPFLLAKLEVSKRWLKMSSSMQSDAKDRPRVVFDELTNPPVGFTVGSNLKQVTLPIANAFFTAAPQGVLSR